MDLDPTTPEEREENAITVGAIVLGVPLVVLLLILTGLLPFGAWLKRGDGGGGAGVDIPGEKAASGPFRLEWGSPRSRQPGEERVPTDTASSLSARRTGPGPEEMSPDAAAEARARPRRGGSLWSGLRPDEPALAAESSMIPAWKDPGGVGGEEDRLRRENRDLRAELAEMRSRLALELEDSSGQTAEEELERLLGELSEKSRESESLKARVVFLEDALGEAQKAQGDLVRRGDTVRVQLTQVITGLRASLDREVGENTKLRNDLATLQRRLDGTNADKGKEAMARENQLRELRKQLDEEKSARAESEKQLADLRKRFDSMKPNASQLELEKRLEAEAKMREALTQRLVDERSQREELQRRVDDLQKGKMPNAAEQELANLRKQLKASQDELASVKNAMGAYVPAGKGQPADLTALNRKYQDALKQIQELERLLRAKPSAQAQSRSEIFRRTVEQEDVPVQVKRAGELSIRAVPLFKALQHANKNNVSIAERDRLVQANRLGVLMDRCYFERGASSLSQKCRDQLQAAVRKVPADAYVLVVGYASLKGTATYNEKLSSSRAANVTSFIRPKITNGKVQMVYFGETSQFDRNDLAKNRVVEVWRIDR